MEFNAQAANANVAITLLDNSVDFGSIPVRIVKMKASSCWEQNMNDERILIMAVYRQTEGSTALDLDDEDAVKNATQNGQFYRRPFMTHTNNSQFGAGGEMDHMRKPLILENVLLDDDDDIIESSDWPYAFLGYSHVSPTYSFTSFGLENDHLQHST